MRIDEDLYAGPLDLPGEPLPGPNNKPPGRRRKRKWLLAAVVVSFILFGAALGLDVFDKRTNDSKSDEPANNVTNQQENQNAEPSGQDDVPEAFETETFTASRSRLTLEHPVSWTVAEKDGGVTVLSPEFTFNRLDGEPVKGFFKIYIRQGARDEDSAYIGSGVAALPSEPLKYEDPAVGQREETNLSFFGIDAPDNFAFFFIAGNFSLSKGDTLGPDYGKEPGTYIVAGGYASDSLEADLATHKVPLDYFQTTKAFKQAMGIIKSLKL